MFYFTYMIVVFDLLIVHGQNYQNKSVEYNHILDMNIILRSL